MPTGIYSTTQKDGKTSYRVSITYKNKHISLGSTPNYEIASMRYALASQLVRNNRYKLYDYTRTNQSLDFDKWVILLNFRDNGLYFKTPIYLSKSHFTYFLNQHIELIFDVDDLFFYSTHKIFRRGNYFFVNDYGMQINILSRYGVRNYASKGKDYYHIDNNPYNLRYENIHIVNPYIGVEQVIQKGHTFYKAKIHVNGYMTIGYYKSIHKAAIAYNKAVDFMLRYVTPNKEYSKNYISDISKEEHDYHYVSIKLPDSLITLAGIV